MLNISGFCPSRYELSVVGLAFSGFKFVHEIVLNVCMLSNDNNTSLNCLI